MNRETILNVRDEVPFLTFQSLSQIDFIKHGFSTKLGGVSSGHLSSMNLSFTRGDQVDCVYENYRRICGALQVSTENLVFSDQVHDTKIHVVTEIDRAGYDLEHKKLIGIDGLITNVPGLVLATSYADCVPLYFIDTKQKAIGLTHSGWRGTVGKIGAFTVKAMEETYGSNPNDIIALIGPSICKDCYEVSQDVADQFRSAFSKEEAALILEDKKNEKFQLNLWNANHIILNEAGIPEEQIHCSDVCTCCNHELLYSHRFTNGKRGNLSAFLSLNE